MTIPIIPIEAGESQWVFPSPIMNNISRLEIDTERVSAPVISRVTRSFFSLTSIKYTEIRAIEKRLIGILRKNIQRHEK